MAVEIASPDTDEGTLAKIEQQASAVLVEAEMQAAAIIADDTKIEAGVEAEEVRVAAVPTPSEIGDTNTVPMLGEAQPKPVINNSAEGDVAIGLACEATGGALELVTTTLKVLADRADPAAGHSMAGARTMDEMIKSSFVEKPGRSPLTSVPQVARAKSTGDLSDIFDRSQICEMSLKQQPPSFFSKVKTSLFKPGIRREISQQLVAQARFASEAALASVVYARNYRAPQPQVAPGLMGPGTSFDLSQLAPSPKGDLSKGRQNNTIDSDDTAIA